MRLSHFAYGAMQIAIVGGFMWLHFNAVANDPDYTIGAHAPFIIGVVFAALATAAVYWSHRGVRRLLGKPNLPHIPPTYERKMVDLSAFGPNREQPAVGGGRGALDRRERGRRK